MSFRKNKRQTFVITLQFWSNNYCPCHTEKYNLCPTFEHTPFSVAMIFLTFQMLCNVFCFYYLFEQHLAHSRHSVNIYWIKEPVICNSYNNLQGRYCYRSITREKSDAVAEQGFRSKLCLALKFPLFTLYQMKAQAPNMP